MQYLTLTTPTTWSKYKKREIKNLLNKKIMITKNHVENINCNPTPGFNIISLFETYGFVFTNDMYILLVRKNGFMIDYISKDKQTDELWKIAVQQNVYTFHNISDDKKTDELCEIAVKRDGCLLKYVPNDKKTDKICKIAIQQNGLALFYVPKNI